MPIPWCHEHDAEEVVFEWAVEHLQAELLEVPERSARGRAVVVFVRFASELL